MIDAGQLRLSNYVLYKVNNKINTVKLGWSHFDELAKGGETAYYPVALKADLLQRIGFDENKDYPLFPQAREFKRLVPVNTDLKTELVAYIKSNGECFAQALVDGKVASNPVHHLHSLQNLYFALVGKELDIKI